MIRTNNIFFRSPSFENQTGWQEQQVFQTIQNSSVGKVLLLLPTPLDLYALYLLCQEEFALNRLATPIQIRVNKNLVHADTEKYREYNHAKKIFK